MAKEQDEFKKKIQEIINTLEDNPKEPVLNPKQITQGNIKIVRLIEDLIRNKIFLRLLKKVIKEQEKWYKKFEKGNYDKWTKKEKEEHDYWNKEAGEIIDEYEKLKIRAKKLTHNKEYKHKQAIAWKYGLDMPLINLAIALYKNDRSFSTVNYLLEGGDMVRVHSDYQDEIMPLNKGEDFSRLSSKKQLELITYPVSIRIHRNASKRDLLDFIEKQWWIIDGAIKEYDEKPYRARSRKHSQKMLDFIWKNRSIPIANLKKKLDEEFPNNGLVYYELSKIIGLEKQRRLGIFEI